MILCLLCLGLSTDKIILMKHRLHSIRLLDLAFINVLKTFIFRVDVMSQFNVFDDSMDISIELLIVL